MRRRFLWFLTLAALVLLSAADASGLKPAGGSGEYTLVENARLVQPGNASPTAAQTSSTGDPFTWGAVELPIPARLRLRYGDYTVTHVYVDLDGGWFANQTVDFDNTRVNKQLVTYEG